MQEKKFSIRDSIEPGIYVAILAVLIYFSTFVPLNLIINFVLPLPAAYLYVKYDVKYFCAGLLAAFVVSFMSMDKVSAIVLFSMLVVVSTILGYCIKNNVKTVITFAIVSAVYIIFGVIYFTVLIKLIIGMDYGTFITNISKMFQSTINDMKKLYIDNGMSQSQIDTLTDPLNDIFSAKSLGNLIPSLVIVTSVVYSYIECAITIYFLKKMKLQVPSMIQFTKIHMHNVLVAFGIIAASIGILLHTFNIGFGEEIYTTTLIIGESALLICGISLVVNILKRRVHINNALIVFIIIVTLIFPITAYAYVFLGLVDAFVDFRKISLKNANKK